MENSRGTAISESIKPEVTTLRAAAKLTSLTERQIQNIINKGLVCPRRGAGNRYEFSFQDLLILRRISALSRNSVSMRKILKNISLLQASASMQPLSAVNIQTNGSEIVVQERNALWNPETGQTMLNFDAAEESTDANVHEIARKADESDFLAQDLERRIEQGGLASEDWYQIGVDLESLDDSERACNAYRQAIRLDESNVNAYLNLGRLLQLNDKLPDAKRLYEKALQVAPDSELASYNLGTIFDTLDEFELAIKYYRRAPNMAPAHNNLSRIYELLGDEVSARRHFKRSKELEDRFSGSY